MVKFELFELNHLSLQTGLFVSSYWSTPRFSPLHWVLVLLIQFLSPPGGELIRKQYVREVKNLRERSNHESPSLRWKQNYTTIFLSVHIHRTYIIMYGPPWSIVASPKDL